MCAPSCPTLATTWIAAPRAPLHEIFRHESCAMAAISAPRDLPHPCITQEAKKISEPYWGRICSLLMKTTAIRWPVSDCLLCSLCLDAQSCPILFQPMTSLPGSSVHERPQARILCCFIYYFI